VWPLVTDTDRANRLVGGRPVKYRAIEEGEKTSARFVAETETGGFAVTYEEAPFEWTLEKSFSVYRRMRGGPLKSYTYGITLDPLEGGGTRVTIRLSMEPRHWLLRPVVSFQAKSVLNGFADVAKGIDEHVRANAPSPFERPRSPANEHALERGARELEKRGIDVPAIEKLVEMLRDGADADLIRVRPFEMAETWKLDRSEVLRAFLHAVTAGLFELRWALVCPSCRTANVEVESLDALGDAGHCQLCDINYGIDLDQAVEATFVAHPAVREVTSQMFCMGGPARTPHVLVQKNVDDGKTATLEAPHEASRYRLFSRGGAMCTLELKEGAPQELDIDILSDEAFSKTNEQLAPGGTIRVKNKTGDARHVKIERMQWANLAATAHVVTLMSEFRRLFSRDLLKPSTPLKVASSAILFSDLTGSTALYTTVGDAAAFRLVDDHFDVLRASLDPFGGTVVKTMGDAIMAAFPDPIASIRAATQCLRAFDTFKAKVPHGDLIGLKLGVFSGPCYVVTANGAIDYFGQTVNCAARVQHLATSGELILERSLFDVLPEKDRAALTAIEDLTTHVKGVDKPLELVRTKLAGVGAERASSASAHAEPAKKAEIKHENAP
jgi:class 3 adenylate cyclase